VKNIVQTVAHRLPAPWVTYAVLALVCLGISLVSFIVMVNYQFHYWLLAICAASSVGIVYFVYRSQKVNPDINNWATD
jgi:hypothetical protein